MYALVSSTVGVLTLSLCASIVSRLSLCTDGMEFEDVKLANKTTVWIVGALLWPFVWYMFAGIDVLKTTPLSVVGLAWPIFLLYLDTVWVTHHSESNQNKQTLSYDGNAITSLAFALGGLLVTNIGKDFARTASPILTACVFLITAFVIPTPGSSPSSHSAGVVLAIQKVSLSYCVGLLLTAVCINLSFGLKFSKKDHENCFSKALKEFEK